MPIYEYTCSKCKHRFETVQKVSDPHLKKCPKCGGLLHKLISPPALQFKGAGWYITDYARKGGAEKTEKTEKKPEAKKDSPPEKPSPPKSE
jgi:putative FmdB family regulatory protein